MPDYVICARNTRTVDGRKVFGEEPGPTKFLEVPDAQDPDPSHAIARTEWVVAETGTNPQTKRPIGDILVFIHGFNNSQEAVMKRLRRLKVDIAGEGFDGVVIAYDWPSGEQTLGYLEDRDDAKKTASRLRDDCIALFCTRQALGCEINVHLLAHSTGAYVIRQAFRDSDEKASIKNFPWKVSQIAFIGADVSRRSMGESDSKSLYRHCVRLTNYQNPFDSILKVSNTKRFGVSPRVGRVGLPKDASSKAVNVNCGAYFDTLNEDDLTLGRDYYGTFCHSWHIGNPHFTKDLCYTIQGDIDRHAIPTREVRDGELVLNTP